MEKRKHLRVLMDNISVDVSDGNGAFQGLVSDVSRSGIRMTDLPKRINGGANKLTVVISWKRVNFKMNVRTRWQTFDDARISLGAEIINVPWSWTEYVMKHEPPQEKDVWGEIQL